MPLYRLNDSPYWWMSLKDPHTGKRIRKSTGLQDKALAQKALEQFKAALLMNTEHPLIKRPCDYTWNEAAARFLKETTHKADHRNDLNKSKVFQSHWGGMKLDSIKQPHISQFVNSLQSTNVANSTINRYLTFAKAVMNKAHKQWGWLETVPAFPRMKEPTGRIRFLTKEQAKALLQELPPHLRDMACFALSTGLRASNITGLQWNQVDLANRHLWIEAEQAKAGKAIAVPLNDEAWKLVQRQVGNHPTTVFVYKGRPVTRPNNSAWKKALKRLGIRNFRWHDLRHTWASWHMQNGTPIHILQELGGWHSTDMVKRYAHLTSDHLRAFSHNVHFGD